MKITRVGVGRITEYFNVKKLWITDYFMLLGGGMTLNNAVK